MKTTLYFTLSLITFATFAFAPNSFSQSHRPLVQCIYFIPADSTTQACPRSRDTPSHKKVPSSFMLTKLQRHGFERKNLPT